MTIREATAADVPACVAMGLRFAETVGDYRRLLPVNADALLQLGYWLLDHGTVLVAERDDAPVGMLGLSVQPHPMTGQLVGMEVFWWVNEDARGRGIRLLHAGEQWAQDRGAVAMQMIAPDVRISALLERLRYEKLETAFQRTF